MPLVGALRWGIQMQPKICQKEIETLEHLVTNCAEDTIKNNKRINQILGEKGEGIS